MTISESPNAPLSGTGTEPTDVFSGPVLGAAPSFPARDAASAYQTVAWRAPTPARFDGRPANDFLDRAEAVAPRRVWRAERRPADAEPAGWFTFTIGACVAALLGALIGGLLSV